MFIRMKFAKIVKSFYRSDRLAAKQLHNSYQQFVEKQAPKYKQRLIMDVKNSLSMAANHLEKK